MGGLRFKHLFRGSFVEPEGTFQVVVIVFLLSPCSLAVDYRAAPLTPNDTFLWAWNVPAEDCIGSFNYSLDMSFFSLIGSPQKSATGQAVTIFYIDRLGKYPYLGENLTEVYGGVPQAGNFQEHLEKAKTDIEHYIPEDQLGLAVIAWDEWRPVWERNWKSKEIYQRKSVQLVRSKNSSLNIAQAHEIAKQQLESAARKYMEETLKLGKKLRPQYFWGFFLFPDCYNYLFTLTPGYTGSCPNREKGRNDNLTWIWKESTALYPATYLKSELKSLPSAKLFNRHRVLESIRMSKVREEKNPLPVFLYTRVVFSDRIWEFLSLVSKSKNYSYGLLCRNSVNRNAMFFKSIIQLYVSFRNTDISSSMF